MYLREGVWIFSSGIKAVLFFSSSQFLGVKKDVS